MNSPEKNIIPERSGFWKNNYVTYRRLWLDASLNAFSDQMRGVVLDLGGKRENKRGTFQPPEDQAWSWWYLNLDFSTYPDIFSDVTRVPLKEKSVDCIICTEVLEHLTDPQACVNEIHRLLRDQGLVFASVPFFYPVHADPYDFQRFTEDGLRYLFRNFRSVEVYRMGGYAGVLGLLLELAILDIERNSHKAKLMAWAMKWVAHWLCWYDIAVFNKNTPRWNKYTTGYFVKASR